MENNGTPILDSLKRIKQKQTISFHALPLTQSDSQYFPPSIEDFKYIQNDYFKFFESTYTGSHFDNPVAPTKCVQASTEITAKTFGADHSFYITSGTTTSNQIAVLALADSGARVLSERSCHQSIHLALTLNRSRVDYVACELVEKSTNRRFMDIEKMFELLRKAKKENDPYKLIILNGSSYEGVLKNHKNILKEIYNIDENISILVDEAWFCFGYFNDFYKDYCALKVIQDLNINRNKLKVIVTQSAHKTLNSLRQGSYLHVIGEESLVNRVKELKYALHTTSPSYPILLSLELARADALKNGSSRISNAFQLRNNLVEMIKNTSLEDCVSINTSECFLNKYFAIDPLKVSINLSKIKNPNLNFKNYFYDKFGIYVTNYTETSVLISLHFGINNEKINSLIHALENLRLENQQESGDLSNNYIIPYPPGVPLVVPGERVSSSIRTQLKKFKENGIDIFSIAGANI